MSIGFPFLPSAAKTTPRIRKLAPEQMALSISPTRNPRDGNVFHLRMVPLKDDKQVVSTMNVNNAANIAKGATGFFQNSRNHIAMQNPGNALTTQCKLQKPKLRRNLPHHSFKSMILFG
jgi:hypothetical protein